jgi:hypothetical protein
VVLKVRGIHHLSHGEIVLVTSDDDTLSYKVCHTKYDTDYVPEM